MDSFLHNIYEVCVDGLHFTEWKHFLCIFIRFSSGMERKGGEVGRRGEEEEWVCKSMRGREHKTESTNLRAKKSSFHWLCVSGAPTEFMFPHTETPVGVWDPLGQPSQASETPFQKRLLWNTGERKTQSCSQLHYQPFNCKKNGIAFISAVFLT